MNCVGLMRVKNEARWIKRAVESLLPLCAEVIMLDDHSTDGTPDIARHAGARVIHSHFEDMKEHRDREFLLQTALQTGADWAIMIDGDEELDCRAPEYLRVAAHNKDLISLRIAHFWGDPQHVRVDESFYHCDMPMMFKLQQGQTMIGHATAGDCETHGGRVPFQFTGKFPKASAILWHYGNMLPEDRARKYEFYTKHDTRPFIQDQYYNALKQPRNLQLVPASEFYL